jgi:bifunctional non-homologous end joining protein LigD
LGWAEFAPPPEKLKELLAKLLKGSHLSIVLNEDFEEDGAIVLREACKLVCEGIVSKRLGSPYCPGALTALPQCASSHGRG